MMKDDDEGDNGGKHNEDVERRGALYMLGMGK